MGKRNLANVLLAILLCLVAVSLSAAWGAGDQDASTLALAKGCTNVIPKLFAGDFDGDGRSDLGIYRPDENAFYVSLSTGKAFGDTDSGRWIAPGTFGNNAGQYFVGNFDGDLSGRDDLGFYDPGSNTFHATLSTGKGFGRAGSGQWIVFSHSRFQNPNGRFFIGYFNGGLKADLGFFDPTNNSFYVALGNSSGTGFLSPKQWIAPNEFGNASGKYVVGDFNDDGSQDLGFFEPGNGSFSVSLSNGVDDFGKTGSGVWIPAGEFGNAGGRFYASDFSGDGRADLGFFEPGNNTFWVALSNGAIFPFEDRDRWVAPNAFGHSGGQYVIGDYNSGGKSDLGFFDPGDLSFHVGLSNGSSGFNFTGSGKWASLRHCRLFVPLALRNR